MIAFVQPFGLNDPGGGSRILRALVAEAPMPYVSICTRPAAPVRNHAREIHLPVRPHFGRVESTRLALFLPSGPLEIMLSSRFKARLRRELARRGATVVHAIPHGMDFWYAREVAWAEKVAYVLNVHDDLEYNIGERSYYPVAVDRLERAWKTAHQRFVISDAMSSAYKDRFGDRPCKTVTDGLKPEHMASRPAVRTRRKAFYFMGAMHLSYHPNVKVLMEALAKRSGSTGTQSTFIVRGSESPVNIPGVSIDERPFANEAAVQADFSDADVLYFPLPFGEENASFVRYSLSTKLVTYLGSGLPILYHGPLEAAAAQLLAKHDAAVLVGSLQRQHMAKGFKEICNRGSEVAQNALKLGSDQFLLAHQRSTFWDVMKSLSDSHYSQSKLVDRGSN